MLLNNNYIFDKYFKSKFRFNNFCNYFRKNRNNRNKAIVKKYGSIIFFKFRNNEGGFP